MDEDEYYAPMPRPTPASDGFTDADGDKLVQIVRERMTALGLKTTNKSAILSKVASVVAALEFIGDEETEARRLLNSRKERESESLDMRLDNLSTRINNLSNQVGALAEIVRDAKESAESIGSATSRVSNTTMSDVLAVYLSAMYEGIQNGVSSDTASTSASYVAWACAQAPSMNLPKGGDK